MARAGLTLSAQAAGLLLLAVALLTGLYKRPGEPEPTTGTWSIVAIDPESGEAGAAGASCVPINAAVLAALVPGKGAAAIQAEFAIENRDHVSELLQAGVPAEAILDEMTETAADASLSRRQYGLVTLLGGQIQATGFTGEDNFEWAGDKQDTSKAVSVQGNALEEEAVLLDALDAFIAGDAGPLPLADRLVRALEAGSAAGGDRRCNQNGDRQTALTAFVAVLQAGQAPFALPLSSSTAYSGPEEPWLYIAIIEEPGGPNPLLELRREYDRWRALNLASCQLCDHSAIAVPPGASPPDEVGIPLEQEMERDSLEITQPDSQASDVAFAPTPSRSPSSPDESAGLDPRLVPLLFFIIAGAIVILAGFVIVRRSGVG